MLGGRDLKWSFFSLFFDSLIYIYNVLWLCAYPLPPGTLPHLFLLGPIFFLPSPPMTTCHIWMARFVTHFPIPQLLNACHLLFYDAPWSLRGKKVWALTSCLRLGVHQSLILSTLTKYESLYSSSPHAQRSFSAQDESSPNPWASAWIFRRHLDNKCI